MSQWTTQREEFYRIAISQGMRVPEDIEKAFPLGHSLPPGKMEKWLSRLQKIPKDFASQRRYVNRFKIGADPEFVFLSGGDTRVDARRIGLKQGPAFGADNNGRLAEIRPHPSRSALEVVASILSTFRWMSVLCPETMKYQWHCGAYILDDGIGGHVHFGRKRPTREGEIGALDSIEEMMLDMGIYPREQVQRRRGGDAHRQIYGSLGDFRLQSHGYEYRTFPSWLDSPELAFLTLTLAKLAVHDPGFVPRYAKGTAGLCSGRLRNLLSYYKDSDDDARLALVMMRRENVWPRHVGGDFRGRWGIRALLKEELSNHLGINGVQAVPLSIAPTEAEVGEMFNHLMGTAPLVFRIEKPSWSPTAPPPGYTMLIHNTDTLGQKGLGEFVWDICYANENPQAIYTSRDFRGIISIPKTWSRYVSKELAAKATWGSGHVTISNRALEQGHGPELKKLLLDGSLPLWRLRDVRPDSYEGWKRSVAERPKRFVGKWLRDDGKIAGVSL